MKAYINGISYYLPKGILSNEDLARDHPEWSVEKISEKTGIFQRHISASNEYSSDMAVAAIGLFFTEYPISKTSINFLLFCTQSPDHLLPTTACILQDKTGLPKSCGALDINLGCSGYIYGLGLARGLIESGQARNILLVTSETYTKLIHPKDKSNKTIFGDAASVTLITCEPKESSLKGSISGSIYGTDGSGFDYLIVKNSGIKAKKERSEDVYDETGEFLRNDDFLYMNGKEIFQFSSFEVPRLINNLLSQNSLSVADVDMFVFHQANKFMLDFVRKRCQIPEEKFFVSLEDIGNTVSSTIPIALKRAINQKKILSKNIVVLVGFGVGLSLGATIVFFE